MKSLARRLGLVTTAALAVVYVPVFAAVPQIDTGAIRLDYLWGEGDRLEAETFEVSIGFVAALGRTGGGGHVIALNFPFAPGERGDVEFERFDVYAPGARVLVVDAEGTHEIPRSSRVQLLGTALADPRIRIGLSLDADGKALTGLVSHPAGVFDITELGTGTASTEHVAFEIGTGTAERLGIETHTSCETPDHPDPFDLSDLTVSTRLAVEPPGPASGTAATHTAVVAFDTDGEFVGDYANTTAAGNAIADLVTALNIIYERDLNLRVLQGDTVLRTNAGSDPYVSGSTGTQLDEVGDWWEANKSGVSRVFAALLSGKGFSMSGSCGGGGIAWVDQYCDHVVSGGPFDGGSYSATQVLRCVSLSGSSNVNLIGHELGHNAGSVHTHCYSPEVDQCYNGQGAEGCYAGAVSCPDWTATIPGITADKGTVMSYCNFSTMNNGAGCGSTEPFFHPTVITRIQQSINANTPSCVDLIACSVGDDNLTPTGNDNGVATYEACTSIVFGPNYTVGATGNVTATSPLIVLANGTTIIGTFTAINALP